MLPNGATIDSPTTAAAETPPPIFHVGARATDDRIVGVAVNVNFELRDGAKSRGHAISLHEIPLMRRLYAAGTLTILPDWVPATPRLRGLTRGQLEAELERLRGSYILPREGGKADLVAEVYGPSQADQLRTLRAHMITLKNGWLALEAKAKNRAHAAGIQPAHPLEWPAIVAAHITGDEIEALVRMIEPIPDTLDTIEIDPIDLSAPAAVPAVSAQQGLPVGDDDDEPLDPVLQLSKNLEESGLTRQVADTIAMVAVEMGTVDRATLTALDQFPRKADGTANLKTLRTVERILREAGFETTEDPIPAE
jgi:hypothetical protein